MAKRWYRAGLSDSGLDRLFLYIALGAILGARISHFIFWNPQVLLHDPLEFFRFWNGGLSVSGGIALGVLGAFLAAKRSKLDFLAVAAAGAPPTLLGQALGRIGCFLNGDAFGAPSNLPWAISFPRYAHAFPGFYVEKSYSSFAWEWCRSRALVPSSSLASLPMHPTQLYEAGLDLLLLCLILLIQRRRPGREGGRTSLLALVGGYALIRFCLEFLRADHDGTVLLGMTAFQLVLIVIIITAVLFGWRGKTTGASSRGR